MKLTRKQILIVPIVAVLVILVGFLAVTKISDGKTYSKLEKAAANQPYAKKLNDSQRSSVECYPDGKSSTCLAVRYSLSADDCRDIAYQLNGKDQPDSGCELARKTQQYDGYGVVYQAAEASNGGYRLTVSIR